MGFPSKWVWIMGYEKCMGFSSLSLLTNSGNPKIYESMGYKKYGLRGFRLYMYSAESNLE
jgi:hypothetical protein